MMKITNHFNLTEPMPKVQTMFCMKQINGYDCDIYSIFSIEDN